MSVYQKSVSIFFVFLFSLFLSFDGNSQIEATLDRVIICEGDCTDWAPTITEGIAPFIYLWSTGDTDSLITLCPENSLFYKLTITDALNDSIVLDNPVLIGPTSKSPIPTITSPICIGESAYLFHPNFGNSPTYHWSGPNGFESTERNPVLEDVDLENEGQYRLVIKYFDLCPTDTVSVSLEINDLESQSTCDALSRCNIACGIFDILSLSGTTSSETSQGIQPPNLCADENEVPNNIQWVGFVAQPGNHTIVLKAQNCIDNSAGLRFGIYDSCDFSNLISCTNECSLEEFEIESSLLTPGLTYYVYVEGCGQNECEFIMYSQGTMQSIYCNDYVPFNQTTDWHFSVGGLAFSGTFWYNYLRDTTINNVEYRMIGTNGIFDHFGLLLREDEIERKVYQYNETEGNEKILYDFGLEIGDTFIEPTHNSIFHVTEISIVSSHFGPVKKWTLEDDVAFPFTRSFSYTESVGSNYLPIPGVEVVISDPVYWLISAYNYCEPIMGSLDSINVYRSTIDTIQVSICEGEEHEGYTVSGIYSDTTNLVGSCATINSLNLTVLAENDPDCLVATNDYSESKLTIYPVPSSDWIVIEDEAPLSRIKIFNSEMRLVKEEKLKGGVSARINISQLKPGVYILVLDLPTSQKVSRVVKL